MGKSSGHLTQSMTSEMALGYLGTIVDSNAAEDLNFRINLLLTDDDPYLITVKNGVVLYQKNVTAEDAEVTLRLPRKILIPYFKGSEQTVSAAEVSGDQELLKKFMECIVTYDAFFNIIEP